MSFQNKVSKILIPVFTYLLLSVLINNLFQISEIKEYSRCIGTFSEYKSDQTYFSSNDFSLTHESGKEESFQSVFLCSLQIDKLIRSSIFDVDQAGILTQKLAWYQRSAYHFSLQPVWHPSIPIAHRKLII